MKTGFRILLWSDVLVIVHIVENRVLYTPPLAHPSTLVGIQRKYIWEARANADVAATPKQKIFNLSKQSASLI